MNVPFSTLSQDDADALTLCVSRSVAVAAEVLDQGLNVVGDLTARMDQSQGSVQWNGDATVHRGCTVSLALNPDGSDFDFGRNLLRFRYTLTDDVTGRSAFAYMGCFMLQAPDFTFGTTVVDEASPNVGRIAVQVSGQDVSASLDRLVGRSYLAARSDDGTNPVPVLQRVRELAVAAGFSLSTVLVDSSSAATVMPADKAWPLLASTLASTDDTTSQTLSTLPPDAPSLDSQASSWRGIWNDLAGLAGYRAVFADGSGLLRAVPYVNPSQAAPRTTFNTDAPRVRLPSGAVVPAVSPLGPARTMSVSLTAFNRFLFRWSNAADAGYADGDAATFRVMSNDSTGPASIAARGGDPRGVSPTTVDITAASPTDFSAKCDAQFAAALRAVTTYRVSTVPWLGAGHYDVANYVDAPVTGAGGVKVQAAGWEWPFNGGQMTWTWTGVGQ